MQKLSTRAMQAMLRHAFRSSVLKTAGYESYVLPHVYFSPSMTEVLGPEALERFVRCP